MKRPSSFFLLRGFHPTWGEKLVPFIFFLLLSFLFFGACIDSRVKKDLALSQDFRPQAYQNLAVLNLDPQVQFAHFVESELLKKGYRVKEGTSIRELLKKEGLWKDGPVDLPTLSRMGKLLQVEAVVLCNVLEFSRFRDSYRLGIKCVAPDTGNTLWYAEGAKEGRKGQKSSELLKEIVVSALKGIPPVQ